MQVNKLAELQALWSQLMGDPPDAVQFTYWLAAHSDEVVRHGVVKTAAKNLTMGRTMDQDHRVRYASSVMNNATTQPLPKVRSAL